MLRGADREHSASESIPQPLQHAGSLHRTECRRRLKVEAEFHPRVGGVDRSTARPRRTAEPPLELPLGHEDRASHAERTDHQLSMPGRRTRSWGSRSCVTQPGPSLLQYQDLRSAGRASRVLLVPRSGKRGPQGSSRKSLGTTLRSSLRRDGTLSRSVYLVGVAFSLTGRSLARSSAATWRARRQHAPDPSSAVSPSPTGGCSPPRWRTSSPG